MKRAISYPTAVLLLVLLAAAPAAAGPTSPAVLGIGEAPSGTRIVLAGFGDGSPTGSRHSKRNSSGTASSKPIEPSHADLHGATRESADKAYRKQYGF